MVLYCIIRGEDTIRHSVATRSQLPLMLGRLPVSLALYNLPLVACVWYTRLSDSLKSGHLECFLAIKCFLNSSLPASVILENGHFRYEK